MMVGHDMPVKKQSLWKQGRSDIKKFYEVKLARSTSIKTFIFGMIITVLIVLPFALILMGFFRSYSYHLQVKLFLTLIGWALLWVCNGISNYYTIRLAKYYYPEDPKLQAIDEISVFFYETLNPGFIVFTFLVLIFFVLGTV